MTRIFTGHGRWGNGGAQLVIVDEQVVDRLHGWATGIASPTMGHPRNLFLLLAAVAILDACHRGQASNAHWDAWRRMDNAYADHFQIWEKEEERLVLVFGHGGDRDTAGVYWLPGSEKDMLLPVQATRLGTALRTVAVGSTTHVPFICALGRADAIAACAHIDQVRTPAFQERVLRSPVQEIATGDGLDREVLAALKPQALFGYPFGRGEGHALEGLSIPTIEVSEYLEEHPLGRAEWLRFFGTLFGEERKADSLFAGIRERYERLRVDSTTTACPTVLFGSVWNGQWWVPPGNSYMARLIEDAGGRYVFADRKGEGNISIDMETMLAIGSKADWWGMVAQLDTTPAVRDFTNGDERLMRFTAVEEQHLFIGNTRVSDLFGQALLEPDIVLADLRNILVPHGCVLVPAGWLPPYFRHINDPPPTPRISTERFEAVQ